MLLKVACSPETFYDQSSNDSGIDMCLGLSRSPLPGETASPASYNHRTSASPMPGLTEFNNHSPDHLLSPNSPNSVHDLMFSSVDNTTALPPQKKYLGVRVRMPVKEILKRLRGTSDVTSVDPEKKTTRTPSKVSGLRGRVHPYAERRVKQNKTKPEKATEVVDDLEILVEVLQADLLKSQSKSLEKAILDYELDSLDKIYRELQADKQEIDIYPIIPCMPACQKSREIPSPYQDCNSQYRCTELAENPICSSVPDLISRSFHSTDIYNPSSGVLMNDTVDCRTQTTCVDSRNDFQVPSPQSNLLSCPQGSFQDEHSETMYSCTDTPHDLKACSKLSFQQDPSAFSFFQFQLHREETLLRTIPAHELLAVDKNGNTLLHKAVMQGKRASTYALANKMASLNAINVVDNNGRTPLHLAAEKNQHLMVSDLISLGGNINKKDNLGKTPLHLCAENGYHRVLEVLKNMKELGTDLEVDATDNNGLTPLHCSVLAHSAAVKEYEKCSLKPELKKFLTLRKEYLLDGMDILLQMGANPYKQVPNSCKTAMHLANEEGDQELLHFFERHSLKIYDFLYEDYASYSMLNALNDVPCFDSAYKSQTLFSFY
ncbi:uncharacterized protein LOC122809482 [Protopterus annectens]|uniref:uncharacterized protein LOC122809482 n=1 Tax=Protopterus annectens TaxID=7888 RepID=UPI001CFC36C4|nr:uncharacterized protein LOC122809482 [Protopterus annectens]